MQSPLRSDIRQFYGTNTMSQRAEIEWHISDYDPEKPHLCYVRERLVGTDHMRVFGPFPRKIAHSFISARRAFFSRRVLSTGKAIQIFEASRQGPKAS